MLLAGVTPQCTAAEQSLLTTFGLESSRLDAPDTIAALLGGSIVVEKPKLTAPSGLLSNGEGYPDYANCVWAIAPLGATRITLFFRRFTFETDLDFVYVYDGLSTSDPLLAKLTGESLPPAVTSTRGAMLVLLKADGSRSARGFEASYRSDNAPEDFVPSWQEAAGVCKEATYRDYVSFACRLCVLATVGSVCGENCIVDHMHMVDRTQISKVRPTPCLPVLSLRLATEQSMRLGYALERSEAFGLSLSSPQGAGGLNPTDLYLPVPHELVFGRPVYVGMDTGCYILSCDPNERLHLWVIRASLEHARLSQCEGAFWVDLTTGAARNQVELPLSDPQSASVPFMVHDGLGKCTETLSLVPPISQAGALRLEGSTAACWLARFWGPQSAAAHIVPAFIELDLPEQRTLALLSDLIIPRGHRLSIIGGDAVIVVGPHQVHVRPSAELHLDRVTVASSVASSAVLVEGRLIATNSTFRNCTARLNVLGREGSDSQGGAVYVAPLGELVLNSAHVVNNAVKGGKGSTSGGGIYATRSKVTMVDSTLEHNSAHTDVFSDVCTGGAIALVDGTACVLNNTWLAQNSVRGGRDAAGGAIYAAGSSIRLFLATIYDNIVHGAVLSSSGGGLAITDRSAAELASMKVLQNVAMDSLATYGGGIYVYQSSSIKAQHTAIRGNTVKRSSDRSYGGGLFLRYSCSAELRSVEVLDNEAKDSSVYAYGGGVYARDKTTIAIFDSVWRGNSASNAGRYRRFAVACVLASYKCGLGLRCMQVCSRRCVAFTDKMCRGHGRFGGHCKQGVRIVT